MNSRIVLMTANVQGGIIQFVFQLYHVLTELGYAVKVCMPKEVHDSNLNEIAAADLLFYHKVKAVISKKPYQDLAQEIEAWQPDILWFCDDSVICSEIGLALKRRHIKQLLTLHDAEGYHPTHRVSLRLALLRLYVRAVNHFFYRRVHRFVLLSAQSLKTFEQRRPHFSRRAVLMTLGAHIPQAQEEKPKEISTNGPYLLFFGRIDKYKGIEQLLRTYQRVETQCLPLVIAGNGIFSKEEFTLLKSLRNVTVLHRYIHDGEMKWLFQNAAAVALPYIEATQSGVIPIAYTYGKPVLISNVAGLTQFVLDGRTGLICKDDKSWTDALTQMTPEKAVSMCDEIKAYAHAHFDWKKNAKEVLRSI